MSEEMFNYHKTRLKGYVEPLQQLHIGGRKCVFSSYSRNVRMGNTECEIKKKRLMDSGYVSKKCLINTEPVSMAM